MKKQDYIDTLAKVPDDIIENAYTISISERKSVTVQGNYNSDIIKKYKELNPTINLESGFVNFDYLEKDELICQVCLT